MHEGAQIIPGSGHVLVTGPFAMVMKGPAGAAQDADRTFANIAARGAWTFETVAAALQQLVMAHDLGAVAAVLTAGGDPVVFIFDEAMAIFDGSAHSGSGRDQWETEVVLGDRVELRLAGQSTMPPQHGTALRDGVVPGAGLSLEIALVPAAPAPAPPPPTSAPPPPPAYGAGWGGGPLAQYAHQPPPPKPGRQPPPPRPR